MSVVIAMRVNGNKGIKGAALVLMAVLLLAAPVMAVHTHGKGGYASVETDGYDDGYYLVVWSNSTSSGLAGVFGKLYYVYNNSPASDVIQIYTSMSAFQTAIASSKMDNTQREDNVYLVVWKADDNYPYARLLGYDGSFITDVIKLDNENKTDYVGAGYGNGYFIAVYEGSGNEKLYYTIFDKTGTITDHGLLYQFSGAIQYAGKVAYDPVSGYFGIFLRNKDGSNYDASFISFKLTSDGKLDKSSIHVLQVLDNKKIYGATIAPANGGFVIAYETYYEWYTRKVTISADGTPTLGDENGPYKRGYRAYGGASMDFVDNGTKDYIVFAYEDLESKGGNYVVVGEKLDLDGVPLDGDGSGDYIIAESGKDKRYPAIAAKPAHSPEAYIIAWSDTTNHVVEGSEYLSDFTEVSETNQVPFFSNLAVGIGALLGALWIFRRM